MSAPEISFCLPVFNATGTIERCLRAVLAQSIPSREILVVDNCSTDDTATKIREVLRGVPGMRVVINDKNLGRIENWNRCLELASGRYIKFALANDVLLPGSAEMLLSAAHRRPDAVMICSRPRFVSEIPVIVETVPSNPGSQIFSPQEMVRHLCSVSKNDTGSLNGILMNGETARRVGLKFRPELPFFADLYHAIELSAHGPVVYIEAESHLFDQGNKSRFNIIGLKNLPKNHEVRECSALMARRLAESGAPDWAGFGFLFYQYINHRSHFGEAPLPGYRDTLALFKGTGPFRRQALKHRFQWGRRPRLNGNKA
jgi:hypothetical protein